METLEKLIGLGFAPMMAIILVCVIVLWGTLCGVIIFVHRQFIKDRTERDAVRKDQLKDIDDRLKASEKKHDDCDDDREKLHGELGILRQEVHRMKYCPHKTCPLRLPG